jgi:uroporphyrinogen-III synthase
MPLLLSTKVLTPTQRRHVFLANLSLVNYNGVIIKSLPLAINSKIVDHGIFTSKNAVKFAFQNSITVKNAYCVGEKTSIFLEQSGINVLETATNAKSLARKIIKKHSKLDFSFFCSKQRRNELPELFEANRISFKEYYVYESICNFKTFDNEFDAVLCFSPIGVESYFSVNKYRPLAICIGETTAKAAREFTDKVIISNKTSIESVILKAIKIYA